MMLKPLDECLLLIHDYINNGGCDVIELKKLQNLLNKHILSEQEKYVLDNYLKRAEENRKYKLLFEDRDICKKEIAEVLNMSESTIYYKINNKKFKDKELDLLMSIYCDIS